MDPGKWFREKDFLHIMEGIGGKEIVYTIWKDLWNKGLRDKKER